MYTFESARMRTMRQKLYLAKLANKALEQTREDITFPVSMFNKARKYMVTDLSIDKISYLATELSDYNFDANDIYTMEGQTVSLDKYEAFYPDVDRLKEMMISIFYNKVIETDI